MTLALTPLLASVGDDGEHWWIVAPFFWALWLAVLGTILYFVLPRASTLVRGQQGKGHPGRAVRARRDLDGGVPRADGRASLTQIGAGTVAVVDGDNGIVVEQLVREYKKGPRAVDGIDIEVAPGEIYGFLGPNGAGKSTTVHVLTTLLPPTSGTARVGGFDVVKEGPKVRSLIGVALQEAALDPLLTGRDHLRLQATLQGVRKDQRRLRADDLLERVGLADAGDRKVSGYSGGMKRRLDLALALIHEPRVLFLDEPTTGLDPQSRTALWEEVARLRREEAVTVFLTTQYLEEADVLADRVGIIDQGKIVAEGTPADLKAEIGRPSVHAIPHRDEDRPAIAQFLSQFGEPLATTRDVAVRLRNGLGLTDIVRAVDQNGVDIVDIELRAPTLDDVFLAKTGRTLEGAAEEADSEQQETRGR